MFRCFSIISSANAYDLLPVVKYFFAPNVKRNCVTNFQWWCYSRTVLSCVKYMMYYKFFWSCLEERLAHFIFEVLLCLHIFPVIVCLLKMCILHYWRGLPYFVASLVNFVYNYVQGDRQTDRQTRKRTDWRTGLTDRHASRQLVS